MSDTSSEQWEPVLRLGDLALSEGHLDDALDFYQQLEVIAASPVSPVFRAAIRHRVVVIRLLSEDDADAEGLTSEVVQMFRVAEASESDPERTAWIRDLRKQSEEQLREVGHQRISHSGFQRLSMMTTCPHGCIGITRHCGHSSPHPC